MGRLSPRNVSSKRFQVKLSPTVSFCRTDDNPITIPMCARELNSTCKTHLEEGTGKLDMFSRDTKKTQVQLPQVQNYNKCSPTWGEIMELEFNFSLEREVVFWLVHKMKLAARDGKRVNRIWAEEEMCERERFFPRPDKDILSLFFN